MADKFLTPTVIKSGTTSVSVGFTLQSTTTGAPLTGKVAADFTGSYWRQGGLRTAITLTNLAAVDSVYSSGGIKEVDATNMPGLYRLDLPDAALAVGVDWVVISMATASTFPVNLTIALPTYSRLGDALADTIIETEGNYTIQQALSVVLAALVGVTGTGGTVLKSPNGVATRVSATINGSNERTAMTLTPSS